MKTKLNIYFKYFKYLCAHKYYVMIECFKLHLFIHAFTHDLSKFKPDEFIRYANFLFGDGKNIDYPWFLHYSRNKHHHEFWVDNNMRPVEMPVRYIKQMVADMRAMSITRGDSPSEYYKNNIKDFRLHPKSRKIFESIIDYNGDHIDLLTAYIDDNNDIITMNDLRAVMNFTSFDYSTFASDGLIYCNYDTNCIGVIQLEIKNMALYVKDYKVHDRHNHEPNVDYRGKRIVLDHVHDQAIRSMMNTSLLIDIMKGKMR